MIDGTIVNGLVSQKAKDAGIIRIGHPGGVIPIEVSVDNTPDGPSLKKAAFTRTSRRIMEGFVYVPESLFSEQQ